RTRWDKVTNLMDLRYCFIVPSVRRFMYFMDWGANPSNNWRITRSDQPTHCRIRGTARGQTKCVGWHFTTCYKDPFDTWMKGVGLAQSIGCLGWANVPDSDACATMLQNGTLPFLNTNIAETLKQVMPKDDLLWLPPYMRDNLELWPWLPDTHREGLPLSDWHVDKMDDPRIKELWSKP
ncbi:hypothetical protein LCGC14_2886150, partial [marine sediment metagenome]